LTEVDNKQPFTLTAKVTPTFLKTYDAGTLYIYVKNDYPASIWVGISTQCPLGEGTSAVFEDISLTKQSISDFRLGI
jgi:regulation of enolase protein 1 (concanavalin A-like superfamily)